MDDLFAAAKNADLRTLRSRIEAGADVNQRDVHGFTPLHRAATAGECVEDVDRVVRCIRLLVDHGARLEDTEPNAGRTALYLAVEFSPTVEPVQTLIDAGASVDFEGPAGEHLIDNAWCDDTKALLSSLTGRVAGEPPPEPPSVKLNRTEWGRAQPALNTLFENLQDCQIVAVQDCGTTQDEALGDCAEIFRRRATAGDKPIGICFYTRQDLKRAKQTAQLYLGIWGADEGSKAATHRVGKLVIDQAARIGLPVHWDDDPGTRPAVLLHSFKE